MSNVNDVLLTGTPSFLSHWRHQRCTAARLNDIEKCKNQGAGLGAGDLPTHTHPWTSDLRGPIVCIPERTAPARTLNDSSTTHHFLTPEHAAPVRGSIYLRVVYPRTRRTLVRDSAWRGGLHDHRRTSWADKVVVGPSQTDVNAVDSETLCSKSDDCATSLVRNVFAVQLSRQIQLLLFFPKRDKDYCFQSATTPPVFRPFWKRFG